MFRLMLVFVAINAGVSVSVARSVPEATVSNCLLSESSVISILIVSNASSSILTYFGHSALRICDTIANIDYVYTFQVSNSSDYVLFDIIEKKLSLKLERLPHTSFDFVYRMQGRTITEYGFELTHEEKCKIHSRLDTEMSTAEHSEFDYFTNNCTTRLRDVLSFSLGSFKYEMSKAESFRSLVRTNLSDQPAWNALSSLVFGSRADLKLNGFESIFLPDILAKACEQRLYLTSKLGVRELSTGRISKSGLVWPILCFSFCIIFLVVSFSSLPKLMKRVFTNLVLATTGLFGVAILTLWLGFGHSLAGLNFNLIWLMPLNLVALPFSDKGKYLKLVGAAGLAFMFISPIFPQRLDVLNCMVFLCLSVHYMKVSMLYNSPR